MVEGRSTAAFKTWLADRDDAFRDAVEVVAMDGFTGFKTAAAEEIPDAVTVMDPFHVVRLAGAQRAPRPVERVVPEPTAPVDRELDPAPASPRCSPSSPPWAGP